MIQRILLILFITLELSSCHNIEQWDNDAKGNFEALWTMVDNYYCFFKEKNINWQECHDRYSQRIYDGMPSTMLFEVCAEMLAELKDGHVNLSAPFATSYYTNWWSDYPQNYDQRLLQQYYLGFDCRSLGSVDYNILPQNIGYISWKSFQSNLGEGNIDIILSYFSLCKGLIIDIRDNGGGMVTVSESLTRRFVQQRTLIGYMINKTGPGHDDLSTPFEQYVDPAADGHLLWDKPVVILTNRSTFSAANDFMANMRYLPNVIHVGARTGGGSGMPLSMELPNGWGLRLSSVSMLDAKGISTEMGISPTPECEVDLDPLLALQGIDTMIERAIQVLNE